jgi:hypothetical protein
VITLVIALFGSIGCFIFYAGGVGKVNDNGNWYKTSYWENPYENWSKPDFVLLGGQGTHFHTISFATNPDAVIDIKTAMDLFSKDEWCSDGEGWFMRGVSTGGFENTNGGYEWLIFSAHNHRRTKNLYRQMLEYAESHAHSYGYNVIIRGSEVYPPHEGMIWNGLCRKRGSYPDDFATSNKTNFVKWVVGNETSKHHSIAVILHPQAGGLSGRNNISEAISMAQAGAEMIEIFNGCWETGDDLVVNDHYRGAGEESARGADGNAENYWDVILSQGLRIWGAGSDDFHGLRKGVDPPHISHNWGGNYVWMEILGKPSDTPEDLVRRLEAGSFYVTQGVQILNISVVNDTITIVGDASVDFIEAIGSVGGSVALAPLNYGDGDSGTLLHRSEGRIIQYKPDPNTIYDDLYVRFRLVNTDYDESYYYDEHGDGGGDVYAWTQPFFVHKHAQKLLE